MKPPSWTQMADTNKEDWRRLEGIEQGFNACLVDRLTEQLRSLDVEHPGYPINRFQHLLQSATRAYRDGADEEMIVAALLHDIGDLIAPYNHSELAAAVLKPYVSAKTHWIIQQHGLFQGYYFHHHLGGNRNARDRYLSHPWYQDAVYFCHHYDQNSFDPEYSNMNLEEFLPMLRRIFRSHEMQHLELL